MPSIQSAALERLNRRRGLWKTTFLGLMVTLCLGMGWAIIAGRQKQQTLARLEELGAEPIGRATFECLMGLISSEQRISPSELFVQKTIELGFYRVIGLQLHRVKEIDAAMSYVQDLTHLETLRLSRSNVGDRHLKLLADFTRLEELNINNSEVTDVGLTHLEGMTNLKRLRLIATQVTDAGLEKLERHKRLELLQLRNLEITDAGLVHLMELTTLKELDLRYTHVTEAGVQDLQKALPKTLIRH